MERAFEQGEECEQNMPKVYLETLEVKGLFRKVQDKGEKPD